MRRLVLLIPVVLAAGLLANSGCGAATSSTTGDFKGQANDVAQAISDLGSDARKGDASKICTELFTPALRNKLAGLAKQSGRGTDCADQLKDSIRDADSFTLTIQKVKVTGKTATATVKTKTNRDKDPVNTVTLTNQRGWRLAQLPS